jgi:salicylate hydroxylase
VLSNVAVIGAGVSGLTAAYALRKIGIKVDVFERSKSIAEFGAGITLSKNATTLLEDLGLMERLSNKGAFPMGSFIRDYKNAEIIGSMEFDEHLITLDRRDLVEQLAASLEEIGGKIHLNTGVLSINPKTGEVKTSNQDTQTYGLILVCDGIRSSTREIYFDDHKAQFTNYVAWRGMTTEDNLPKFNGNNKVNVYYGPGSHCVHYPTGRENLINFVAIENNTSWTEESWKVEGNKTELLKCFDGWNEELLSMLSSTTTLYKWGIFERRLPRRLFQDRCILLGDAAHPMVPFLGQGGCLAIEDAYCLMSLLNKTDDLEVVFKNYNKLRNKRARWIQRRSKVQGVFNHISNPLLVPIRNQITKKTMERSVQSIHSYSLKEDLTSLIN